MKTIQLTQGYVALIDDEDYERVAQFKWSVMADKLKHTAYAVTNVTIMSCAEAKETGRPRQKSIKLHRFITGVTDPKIEVDHEDHDGLNNQKYNLRVCGHAQNQRNRRKTKNRRSSQFKGVQRRKGSNRWSAVIHLNEKNQYLGRFDSETDAALAYDAAAREHFGEFALCNFPLKKPSTSTNTTQETVAV